MARLFVIGDTHLGHENIIHLTNRPYNSVQEMDAVIIENWNKTVSDNDTVIHLGDFCMGSKENIEHYAKQLKGNKILIRGNHDRKPEMYENYFTVYKKLCLFGRILLTHKPRPSHQMLKDRDMINIHGHIHGNKNSEYYASPRHIDVSVENENINYTPTDLNDVLGCRFYRL